MDELVTEVPDVIHVFDRAYVDYNKLDCFCDQGIRFARRLKGNDLVETVDEFPVDPEGIITKDNKVILVKTLEPDEKLFVDY